jgi:tRNA A37 methylthiotransferase MiaB
MPKRYHVTTFSCRMNEHNVERMKGMLDSLGYSEAAAREQVNSRPEVVAGVGGCCAPALAAGVNVSCGA